MRLIIAGYTAAPADQHDAAAYYRRLFAEPMAEGLELAWKKDGGSVAELAALAADLPVEWRIAFNAIPSTFREWSDDHSFGLASPDEAGRARAVAHARQISEGIRRVDDEAGRSLIAAIELQSAPGFSQRDYEPDRTALTRSLAELAEFDWSGAQVAIEHCDAFRGGRTPAKGFLELADELEVLSELDSPVFGASLNWGRSVIEMQDPVRVLDHIDAARESGLLRGFTFSGTAGTDNPYGAAWADSHLPLADPEPGHFGETHSLLTMAHVEAALARLGDIRFLAVKTSWPASRTDPLERAESVIANFTTVVSAARADARN